MRTFQQHTDILRQLVQLESRDDLDSAQRHGMYWIGSLLRAKYKILNEDPAPISAPETALVRFECPAKANNYMRTGNNTSRGYYCDMLTRDQQTGIIALILAGGKNTKHRLWPLMKENLKRGWFTNNTTGHRVQRDKQPELVGKSRRDFAGFEQLAMCLRGLLGIWAYPICEILDLTLLFSAIKYRWFNKQREPLNFMVRCGVSALWVPTLSSWLARRITNPLDMFSRLVRYFNRGDDLGPPMFKQWTYETLKKLFVS
jgi:hypothetical protein